MTDFDKDLEQELFDAQAANLDIFASTGCGAYASFRLFEYKALLHLRSEFGPEFLEWLGATEQASKNGVSLQGLRTTREEIIKYRERHLRLKGFAMERQSSVDALTILFLLCLQDWPQKPEGVPRSNIVQGIDEFAATYIEFFGRSEKLIAELKCQFNC